MTATVGSGRASVQHNVSAVATALALLHKHPMYMRMTDDGARFQMTVPEGFSIGAIRCDYSVRGKAWALTRILEVAERYWMSSYPNPERFIRGA